MEFYAV